MIVRPHGPWRRPIVNVADEPEEMLDRVSNRIGLWWDHLHPNAITRLSDDLINMLIKVMLLCEADGDWPRAIALVMIALLPKTDGLFRPIDRTHALHAKSLLLVAS